VDDDAEDGRPEHDSGDQGRRRAAGHHERQDDQRGGRSVFDCAGHLVADQVGQRLLRRAAVDECLETHERVSRLYPLILSPVDED